MPDGQPKIEGAPGIAWRMRKHGWECRWRARSDLAKSGYRPKNIRLWIASAKYPDIDANVISFIQDRAVELQAEMLEWSKGGPPRLGTYDGTWRALTEAFQNDPVSPYRKKRFVTRKHYDTLMRRIVKDCGEDKVAETEARDFLTLHDGWSARGKKIPMGHAMIGMVRTLITFGATFLREKADRLDCREQKIMLHDMRFEVGKARTVWINAEQVIAVRRMAHVEKWPSIALAQAIQFEGMLRQKDVLGEYVPVSEEALSDVIVGNDKWLRGIRWEEIDQNFILRHVTSKKSKPITIPLREAPMVMEEFRLMLDLGPEAALERAMLPASGPVILRENAHVPWVDHSFRRVWRQIATKAGVPKDVRNMDSRSGAITEASDADIPLEHIRHAATHSNTATTEGYSRGREEKTANVLRTRVAHRNKPRTE